MVSKPYTGVPQVFDQTLRHAHCTWDSCCSENHRVLPSKSIEDDTEVAIAYLPEVNHRYTWSAASLYTCG